MVIIVVFFPLFQSNYTDYELISQKYEINYSIYEIDPTGSSFKSKTK